MKVLCKLGKAKAKQNSISITIILSITHIIYNILYILYIHIHYIYYIYLYIYIYVSKSWTPGNRPYSFSWRSDVDPRFAPLRINIAGWTTAASRIAREGWATFGLHVFWIWDILRQVYPLVNVYKKLWKITMFHGKIHYFYGKIHHVSWENPLKMVWKMVIFNSYVRRNQREIQAIQASQLQRPLTPTEQNVWLSQWISIWMVWLVWLFILCRCLDLLKGFKGVPKNKKSSLHRFLSHGGFPIGKIKNHLKQNPGWYGCLRCANGQVWPYQATFVNWTNSCNIYGGFLKLGYPKMEGL